jgi:hypothetical protein
MMAFNDVYFFKMDKAIQNIHHYEKIWMKNINGSNFQYHVIVWQGLRIHPDKLKD